MQEVCHDPTYLEGHKAIQVSLNLVEAHSFSIENHLAEVFHEIYDVHLLH